MLRVSCPLGCFYLCSLYGNLRKLIQCNSTPSIIKKNKRGTLTPRQPWCCKFLVLQLILSSFLFEESLLRMQCGYHCQSWDNWYFHLDISRWQVTTLSYKGFEMSNCGKEREIHRLASNGHFKRQKDASSLSYLEYLATIG